MAFATTDELEIWMGRPAPDEAGVLLERASTVVAYHVRRAVTTDETTGLAVDASDAAALSDATAAQVQQWLDDGDAGLCGTEICDRSLMVLRSAGLTGGPVAVR